MHILLNCNKGVLFSAFYLWNYLGSWGFCFSLEPSRPENDSWKKEESWDSGTFTGLWGPRPHKAHQLWGYVCKSWQWPGFHVQVFVQVKAQIFIHLKIIWCDKETKCMKNMAKQKQPPASELGWRHVKMCSIKWVKWWVSCNAGVFLSPSIFGGHKHVRRHGGCAVRVWKRYLSINRTSLNISEQWVIQTSLSMLLNERRKKICCFLMKSCRF